MRGQDGREWLLDEEMARGEAKRLQGAGVTALPEVPEAQGRQVPK